LEHGAVWLTYDPSALPSDEVELLQDLLLSANGYGLLSPYPGQTSPVIATAWGVQLRTDDVKDPRLTQFMRAYGGGLQAPEQDIPC
jgi:hypothetical protein